MQAFVRKYVEFAKQPDVPRLLLVALLARMPVGMLGFSMLMFLREILGDFAQAGAGAGTHLVAMSVTAPIVGRLIDRHGPRIPLMVTGLVQPLALIGVLAAAKSGMGFTAILAFAALSGLFASPITILTRTAWRYRFEREDDRRLAFTMDAVLVEINFTIGPAIVAAMLATVGATIAFAVSIGVVVCSFLIFFTGPALRYFKRDRATQRHMLGPLTDLRLWIVFLVTFGLAMSVGQLEVGYPAYGTMLAAPALAGILLAINSIGSAVGGAIYGGVHMEMPIERQMALTVGLMSIPLAAHAIILEPVTFAIVAFFAGALIAPSVAAQSVLVSRLAPSHYATEAFTWSSTFIVSGIGAGMAVGGWLAETVGVRYVFALGSVILVAMAALALTLPRQLPVAVPVER